MKKKTKLIIIIAICVVVVLAAVAGIYFATRNAGEADCYNVGMISVEYWGSDKTSEGMVCDSATQSVHMLDGQVIKEVYVTEGQQVKAGDPLLAYDLTNLSFSVEMKELEISSMTNQLQSEKEKLNKLKNTTPVAAPVEPAPEPMPEEDIELISSVSQAIDGDGTDGNEYAFICGKDAYVSGALLNELKSTGTSAVFQTSENGQSPVVVSIMGAYITEDYNDDEMFKLFVGNVIGEEPEEIPEEEPVEESYTASELAQAIAEQERSIKSLDLSIRMAQQELSELNSQLADGTVRAKLDGTVTKVVDLENPLNDGSPIIVVSGEGGLTIQGYVGELELDSISVGQSITAYDWETGASYEGTISSIDTIPSENGYYYGESNPNSSSYPYTAVLNDAKGLEPGKYMELTIISEEQDGAGGLYIEKSYVRKENGKSYVYKAVDGKLVKQQVTTGKTVWGSALEIKDGLDYEDYIAFPYGVKEGAKANMLDEFIY